MLKIHIPGHKLLELKYLAIDFNGTMALDGKLLPGVSELLNQVAEKLDIYVISADTFGTVDKELKGLRCKINLISEQNQGYTKQQFIKQLGAKNVVAVGNGRNDQLMLETAALSMCVIQQEGASLGAVNSADIVMFSIIDAIKILLNPLRLVATLRA